MSNERMLEEILVQLTRLSDAIETIAGVLLESIVIHEGTDTDGDA